MQQPERERPFVDRPVTDREQADTAAIAAADHWGLGRPALIRLGMNAIYRAGDVVLRVSAPSAPARCSIELATTLLDRGLAVSRPVRDDVVDLDDRPGGLSVTAWAYLTAVNEPIDWRSIGEMVRETHAIVPGDVPDQYPMPRPTDFPWWDFPVLFDDVGGVLDDAARDGIEAAIARWPNWDDPSGSVVCHGDVHPGNVVMTADGPVLIDWDLLCWAPPGWDHAPMMTWHERWGGDPAWYSDFCAGYGKSMFNDPAAEAFAELRLVAATLMRLKAGTHSEAAMPEAQRRLAFWRGDFDAPMWQAQ